MTFGDWRNIENSVCENCGASLQTKSAVENTRRVLMFAIIRSDQFYNKICNLSISNVPQTELQFGNKKYVLSSAIFHHGENSQSGHYTAILRKDGKFYCANDGTISKVSWPRNSKDLYMLFYTEK